MWPNPEFPVDLITFIVEILIGKLHFLCSGFFSAQLQRCLTSSWTELKMLLRCCLIHIMIIVLWHILYLVYLFPCLSLGLFMSYLFKLFPIFSLIFNTTNPIISSIHTHFFLHIFLEYLLLFWMITWTKEANNFQTTKVQHQGGAQFLLSFEPFKVLLLKKACRTSLLWRLTLQEMNKTIILNQRKCQKRSFSKSSGRQPKTFSKKIIKTFWYLCGEFSSVKRMFWAIFVMIAPVQMELC